nr:hypothetical protein [Tanacetum cinerariifolium]
MVIAKSDGPLTPNATKLFKVIKDEAAQYKVVWNGEDKYQCIGPFQDQCAADMKEIVSSCRRHDLTRMPCKHAVAATNDMGEHWHGSTQPPSTPRRPSQGIVIRDSPFANTRSASQPVDAAKKARKNTGKEKVAENGENGGRGGGGGVVAAVVVLWRGDEEVEEDVCLDLLGQNPIRAITNR